MCGIAGIAFAENRPVREELTGMIRCLEHRGPDDEGTWTDHSVGLANRRLSILDLSAAGHQPMHSADGRLWIAYNGELYNYIELREELGADTFTTASDTEVVLRAYQEWGPACLNKFNGMYAFAIWDERTRTLFAARDRFGVKPLYYAVHGGGFYFASEIKALARAGVPMAPNVETWRTYLVYGLYDHSEQTFFENIRSIPPGHYLQWYDGQFKLYQYYDLGKQLSELPIDERSDQEVGEEYINLLCDAVRLRFRSDVPVGICLSGGVDSAVLFGAIRQIYGDSISLNAFHFATGDARYDETPWVQELLGGAHFPLHITTTSPDQVPELAARAAYFYEEPYGGLPTLAYSQIFKNARELGVVVLLDGQGMDEQWGGYDYYKKALDPANGRPEMNLGPVQATSSLPTRTNCLESGWIRDAAPIDFPSPLGSALQNWRYRDIRFAKIPRSLRFGDRASMMHSCELREPFLDYRLVELAMRQPADRLIRKGVQKFLLREIADELVPSSLAHAPKRPVQTPQREWLRGPLRPWVESLIEAPAFRETGWFDQKAVVSEWQDYLEGKSDNSFYVWQWVSVALNDQVLRRFKALGQT